MKIEKKNIKVFSFDNDEYVEAECYGNFGVHKSIKDTKMYSISHIQSGLRAFQMPCRGKALASMKELVDSTSTFDWNFEDFLAISKTPEYNVVNNCANNIRKKYEGIY